MERQTMYDGASSQSLQRSYVASDVVVGLLGVDIEREQRLRWRGPRLSDAGGGEQSRRASARLICLAGETKDTVDELGR